MAINVYWACFENEWLRATEPIEIKKMHLHTEEFKETGAIRCPATHEFLHNYYGLKSIYSYDIHVDGDRVWSDQYDQKFFDDHVLIRSKTLKTKCLSFITRFIYFTNEESLPMSMEQPFLEDNDINDNCIMFPGQFDIAKWFRPTDFAFKLKRKSNHFSIRENDIFCYIKFHTKDEIKFTQFRINKELFDFASDTTNVSKNQLNRYHSLESRYKSFSTKKLILKEIEKNILT